MRLASKGLPLDVIESAEALVQSGRFTDLDRKCVHERLIGITKAGGEVSDQMLQHIHDRQVNHFGTTAASAEEFQQQRDAFDNKVWPVIAPLMKRNPGLAQFMLEYGVDSSYVAQFLYDVQKAQGVSILLGHGIAHTVTDDLVPVNPADNAFAFYHDSSFGIFRFRAQVMQREMRCAKRILFLGAGADPSLYARGYPLGQLDQQFTLYDHDPQMPRYLEQIVGPLKDAGIEYRIANIDDVLQDESLHGQYDLIGLLGVAAYYSERSRFLFDGVYNLLAPGGKVVFDLQWMHPVLIFDVAVLGWPATMHVEKDADTAVATAQAYCDASGLQLLSSQMEDDAELAAGVVAVARKPA